MTPLLVEAVVAGVQPVHSVEGFCWFGHSDRTDALWHDWGGFDCRWFGHRSLTFHVSPTRSQHFQRAGHVPYVGLDGFRPRLVFEGGSAEVAVMCRQ